MLRQIVYGAVVSLSNIAVHAAAMALVIGAARATAARWPSSSALRLIAVMMVTVAVLMVAHTCEVAIWSVAYALVDATPEPTDRMYFAFVNFTTLGYGDIVPVPRWRLLGPMTAMNGVILFGWSTAVIFEVLRSTLQTGKELPAPGNRYR
jgi:hypothetical protein